jgi:glycosyltransferase involved in cell wall biosynthesis
MPAKKLEKPIVVIATLPPPVTGMTLATKIIVSCLSDAHGILVHNWSDGRKTKGGTWRFVKAIRSLSSIVYLVRWRNLSSRVMYTVANAGGGLYYNLLIVAVARLLHYRCVVHHQVFSYLHRFDWRMNLVAKMVGRSGFHVVLAPEMKQLFEDLYGKKDNLFILPNTIIMDSVCMPAVLPRASGSAYDMCIGHLSNLTMEKGLGHVISTFGALRSSGLNVRLILAGPIEGEKERSVIREAQEIHGSRIEYRGAVYGGDKARFFQDIDVFLFPTQYRNEAQPLVIAEALSYCRPVIAFGLACIPSLVGLSGGVVLPCDADFAKVASGRIEAWINDPELFRNTVCDVQTHAARLKREADEGIRQLVQKLVALSDSSPGGRIIG